MYTLFHDSLSSTTSQSFHFLCINFAFFCQIENLQSQPYINVGTSVPSCTVSRAFLDASPILFITCVYCSFIISYILSVTCKSKPKTFWLCFAKKRPGNTSHCPLNSSYTAQFPLRFLQRSFFNTLAKNNQ